MYRRIGDRSDGSPHPDAFWTEKYGWMEEATVDDFNTEAADKVARRFFGGDGPDGWLEAILTAAIEEKT